MRQLWLDCDGVLADFDKKFMEEFGYSANMMPFDKKKWEDIEAIDGFFENLEVREGAYDLINAVIKLRPIILTGTPNGDWATPQKLRWRNKHFPSIPMVTCKSINKKDYCWHGDILVDDWTRYRDNWQSAGGIFIHHTETPETLVKLREIGVHIK